MIPSCPEAESSLLGSGIIMCWGSFWVTLYRLPDLKCSPEVICSAAMILEILADIFLLQAQSSPNTLSKTRNRSLSLTLMRGLRTISRKMSRQPHAPYVGGPIMRMFSFYAMHAMPPTTHTVSISTEFHGGTGSVWNVQKIKRLQRFFSMKSPLGHKDDSNPGRKQVFVALDNG